MHLRRIATTLTAALALAGGVAACSDDAERAVDKGAKEAEQAGKKAVEGAKDAGRKAGKEVDKAVDDEK